MDRMHSRCWPRHALSLLMLGASLSAAPASHAQSAAPAAAETHDAAVARAQRETDKLFKWIIQADKPKRAAETKAPAPTAAAAPAPAPTKVVVRAKGEGITEKVEPILPKAPVTQAPDGAAVAKAAAPTPAPGAIALAAPSTANTSKVPDPEPEPEADPDLPLILVHQVDPEVPATVMRRVEKGSVLVHFEVQPDGSVRQAEVLKTSSRYLNPAALEAVAQWRFQPLKHAQGGSVQLVFNFEQ
jgi:protein TonB